MCPDGWMGGWMNGCKSRFKDCLQQSKMMRKGPAKMRKPEKSSVLCNRPKGHHKDIFLGTILSKT